MSVEVEEKAARPRDPRRPEPRPLPLVFERSGKVGYSLPPLDVPAARGSRRRLRREVAGGTQISRSSRAHFTRSPLTSIDQGSTRWVLHDEAQPRTNEDGRALPGFAASHPLAPSRFSQGRLELWAWRPISGELTGRSRASPALGGRRARARRHHLVRRLAKESGRATVLIPDWRTAPIAAAHFAGYKVGASTARHA
jgi:hypothetical protein